MLHQPGMAEQWIHWNFVKTTRSTTKSTAMTIRWGISLVMFDAMTNVKRFRELKGVHETGQTGHPLLADGAGPILRRFFKLDPIGSESGHAFCRGRHRARSHPSGRALIFSSDDFCRTRSVP